MRLVDSYLRLVEKLARTGVHAAGVVVVFMMISTTLDAILRYIFSSPIPGVIELNEVGMVAIVFLCMAWDQVKKEHISVELFYNKFPPLARKYADIFNACMSLLLFIGFTAMGTLSAYDAWVSGDFKQGGVRFPFWPGKAIIPLATALVCMQLIGELWMHIASFHKSEPVK